MTTSNQYVLSLSIHSHQADVKSVSGVTDDIIISGSRDHTAVVHQRDIQLGSFQMPHFVNSVVSSSKYYIVGSQDSNIYVYDKSTSQQQQQQQQVQILRGHKDNVCHLAVYKDKFLYSSSWDKTIIQWDLDTLQLVQHFNNNPHTGAVWCVLPIDDVHFLSASADKSIKLWNCNNNKTAMYSFIGHTDVVRHLALIDGGTKFASCSNDLTIRIWDLTTKQCVDELNGHSAFIYMVKSIPKTGDGADLVSCGEDRCLRIWKNSQNIQTIYMPCVSVWCVDVLENGDIVCGGNDGVIRIFTKSKDRFASQLEITNFEEQVASFSIPSQTASNDPVDKSKLPGIEALTEPGSKPGQVIMVKANDMVEAHQWDADSLQWVKIGEVVDSAKSNRQTYQGVEYDFVFDIDIQEGAPPLKLPYNTSDNPYQTAQEFIHKNELPQSYLEQIAEFIIQNSGVKTIGGQSTSGYADPFTGGTRYVPGGSGNNNTSQNINPYSSTPPTTTTKTLKYVIMNDLISFKTANLPAIQKKIASLNSTVEPVEFRLTENEVKSLDSLVGTLLTNKPVIENSMINVARKIAFNWPIDKRFPGIDLLRVASLYSDNILDDEITMDFILEKIGVLNGVFTSKAQETNLMLGLRLVSNIINRQPTVQVAIEKIFACLQGEKFGGSNIGDGLRLAFVTLLYNYATARDCLIDDSLALDIVDTCAHYLKKNFIKGSSSSSSNDTSGGGGSDQELVFRVLVLVGKILKNNTVALEGGKLLQFEGLKFGNVKCSDAYAEILTLLLVK